MDIAKVLQRFDDERRSLVRGNETIERSDRVTRLAGLGGAWHTLIWSKLDAQNADAEIAAQVEHYRSIQSSFEWKVFEHDSPSDLKDRLRQSGFTVDEAETVLAFDLAATIEDSPGVRVERIVRVEQIATFKSLAESIFHKDYSLTAGDLRRAIDAGSFEHRGYLAFVGDDPAGIGRLYTHPQSWFGGLFGGGVLESMRGRGVYRALLAKRAEDARQLGAKYLTIDAMPTSEPIVRKLGFEMLTRTWPCVWTP